ncbi:MAG: urease accessory protein UreD, partial [Coriobacteriales bacterium]|nr:urease accessory protein UreD [Coriobacteriales bacterium]
MTANQYTRRSELALSIRQGQQRSVIDDVHFTAPFKLTNPFYSDDGTIEVMLISVSAGIMAGDDQLIDLRIGDGASARVTSQAFEKIHRMDCGGYAKRETIVEVGTNAQLIYMPLPVIPFADSDYQAQTTISLAGTSSCLAYGEIISCGRASREERFAYRRFANRVRVNVAGDLAYSDNTVFSPREHDMEGLTLYEGYTHMGSLILFGWPEFIPALEYMRKECVQFPGMAGVSENAFGGFGLRTLSQGFEPALRFQESIINVLNETRVAQDTGGGGVNVGPSYASGRGKLPGKPDQHRT